MPNSLQSSAIASPASRRATNCILSSIAEHSFQGITPSLPEGGSVTHVSGTMCYLCSRPLTNKHDLKNLFKGAAAVACSKPGPFEQFYTALVAKGMRPEMARLTLARKIATIVLIVWKRGVCFDAQHLKPQTA